VVSSLVASLYLEPEVARTMGFVDLTQIPDVGFSLDQV
jgi:hypothetical protein